MGRKCAKNWIICEGEVGGGREENWGRDGDREGEEKGEGAGKEREREIEWEREIEREREREKSHGSYIVSWYTQNERERIFRTMFASCLEIIWITLILGTENWKHSNYTILSAGREEDTRLLCALIRITILFCSVQNIIMHSCNVYLLVL